MWKPVGLKINIECWINISFIVEHFFPLTGIQPAKKRRVTSGQVVCDDPAGHGQREMMHDVILCDEIVTFAQQMDASFAHVCELEEKKLPAKVDNFYRSRWCRSVQRLASPAVNRQPCQRRSMIEKVDRSEEQPKIVNQHDPTRVERLPILHEVWQHFLHHKQIAEADYQSWQRRAHEQIISDPGISFGVKQIVPWGCSVFERKHFRKWIWRRTEEFTRKRKTFIGPEKKSESTNGTLQLW